MDTSKTILFRVGPFPKLSETFIMSQIEGLVKQGFDVRVLADQRSEELPLIDSKIIRDIAQNSTIYLQDQRSIFQKLLHAAPYRIRKAIRGNIEQSAYAQSDIVLCHFGWMGVEACSQIKKMDFDGKLLTVFHGADMSTYLEESTSNPYKELFEVGDGFLPISNFWESKLTSMGVNSAKLKVHRMGVLPSTFQFSPRAPLDDSKFQFISVGRLTEKKGTEYIIRACKLLVDSYPTLSFKLTLIGDGPLEQSLKELASELNVSEFIEFTGNLPNSEVADRLSQSNAFILPSVVASNGDMEGIPVALMEAMASGLPVISTIHSGIPELVRHEETGLLAAEKDIAGLAAAMHTTMTAPEKVANLTQNARKLIETEFNNEILNVRLASYLSAL